MEGSAAPRADNQRIVTVYQPDTENCAYAVEYYCDTRLRECSVGHKMLGKFVFVDSRNRHYAYLKRLIENRVIGFGSSPENGYLWRIDRPEIPLHWVVRTAFVRQSVFGGIAFREHKN